MAIQIEITHEILFYGMTANDFTKTSHETSHANLTETAILFKLNTANHYFFELHRIHSNFLK